MNCSICENSLDENLCENCRYTLYPLQEWMREITGDTGWTDCTNPFRSIDNDNVQQIRSFLAGGRLSFEVIQTSAGNQLVRVPYPIFDYAMPGDEDKKPHTLDKETP